MLQSILITKQQPRKKTPVLELAGDVFALLYSQTLTAAISPGQPEAEMASTTQTQQNECCASCFWFGNEIPSKNPNYNIDNHYIFLFFPYLSVYSFWSHALLSVSSWSLSFNIYIYIYIYVTCMYICTYL